MNITHTTLSSLSRTFGDSFYLLKTAAFADNYREFLGAFTQHYPNIRIGYSYKTNYIPLLCKKADELGAYAEIVSELELKIALKSGVQPENIIYNGPSKSAESLEYCLLNAAMVNLDNNSELREIERIARRFPEKQFRIGIRLNPALNDNFFSRFGYDPEGDDLGEALRIVSGIPNLRISGLHFHSTRPDKSVASFTARLKKLIETVPAVIPDGQIEYIDLGGGFFGKMDDNIRSQFSGTIPSFEDYGSAIAALMKTCFPGGEVQLILEPGVAMTVNVLDFVTRIHDIKTIRGRTIATTGGSFHNVKPSGHKKNLTMHVYKASDRPAGKKQYHIAGYTCLEGDYLYEDYSGDLRCGDFLKFDNVGAYSIVFKPPFIRLAPPVIALDSGQPLQVRRQEQFDDIFKSYNFEEQL